MQKPWNATIFKTNFQHRDVTESGLCLTYACFCKTFNGRGNTSLFLYLLPNTIILGKQPEQPCGGYDPQTTSPNVRHTTEHMKYTSAGVWVHPPTAAFWIFYTRVKCKIWLRNVSYFTTNTVTLSIQYLRLLHEIHHQKNVPTHD